MISEQRRTELESFYRQTDYVVDDGEVDLTIRLGRDNPELNEWLKLNDSSSWAFLTAYNPRSQTLPLEENMARQAKLTRVLAQQGYEYYHGRGVGDDWEEPSLFIVNITRETAVEIGKQFKQNAILWGAAEARAELIWCVD